MIAALSYFRTENQTQTTGGADVSPVEETRIPDAEVDKFIAKMDLAFTKGKGLLIGETHGEVGTYKLLNHHKVQEYLIQKNEEFKLKGEAFISNLYFELPRNIRSDLNAETIGELFDEFNKPDDIRRPDIADKIGTFFLNRTNSATIHHVNEQIIFFKFMHSLGTNIELSDNFITEVNIGTLLSSSKNIYGSINPRNKTTADYIFEKQKETPNSKFIQIAGSLHLEDKIAFPRRRSIEQILDKKNKSSDYSSSIHFVSDRDLYPLKKPIIDIDNYEFNGLDVIDYEKLIVNSATYFAEILDKYPNLKNLECLTLDEMTIIAKDIDNNIHKYIDNKLKQEYINKLYGENNLLPAFKLIIENDLNSIAHIEFIKKLNTEFKLNFSTSEPRKSATFRLNAHSPKINRDDPGHP